MSIPVLLTVLSAGGLLYWLIALMRFSVTRRLAIIVAALTPLWLLSGSPVWLQVAQASAVLVLIAVLVDARLIPKRGAMKVERELPPAVGLGETIEGAYHVRSTAPFAVMI